MTNWKNLLTTDSTPIIAKFANGEVSGRQVASAFKNTAYAGMFRELVRTKGIETARKNARDALRRRKI